MKPIMLTTPAASAAATMALASSSEAPSGFSQKTGFLQREGGLGDGAVGGLRRRDDDRLDRGIRHQVLPVLGGATIAEFFSAARSELSGVEPATISSLGRSPVSNTAPTAAMATAWALPI